MLAAPFFGGVAEVKIAQCTRNCDLADAELAAELAGLGLDLERGESAPDLAQLRIDPVLPLIFLRAQDFIAAEDRRIENAVAQRLLAQRQPARLATAREQLRPLMQRVEIFADDRRIIEHHA